MELMPSSLANRAARCGPTPCRYCMSRVVRSYIAQSYAFSPKKQADPTEKKRLTHQDWSPEPSGLESRAGLNWSSEPSGLESRAVWIERRSCPIINQTLLAISPDRAQQQEMSMLIRQFHHPKQETNGHKTCSTTYFCHLQTIKLLKILKMPNFAC